MAEGEFALLKDYLDAAEKTPLKTQGIPINDNELYFMLADLAVLQRDEAALRRSAPLAERSSCTTTICSFRPAPSGLWVC